MNMHVIRIHRRTQPRTNAHARTHANTHVRTIEQWSLTITPGPAKLRYRGRTRFTQRSRLESALLRLKGCR